MYWPILFNIYTCTCARLRRVMQPTNFPVCLMNPKDLTGGSTCCKKFTAQYVKNCCFCVIKKFRKEKEKEFDKFERVN